MPRTLLLLAFAALAGGCSGRSGTAPPAPPRAEFLIAAGDSTFWVRSGEAGLHVRGSPMVVAHFGGRFYEVYVADDDRSFYDAVLVGQRIYRRDLVSGDSVAVFDDTTVSRTARAYAARHPRERPLGDEEEASEDPRSVATGDVEILDVYGPYLTYEYHADVDVDDSDELHTSRRGVIDLRTGERATLSAMFGRREGVRLTSEGRRLLAAVRDSIRAARGDRARRAAEALDDFHFDPASFVLLDAGRRPTVAFLVPGRGDRAGGLALSLPPIPTPPPAWWRELDGELPTAAADSTRERWAHGRVELEARYDTAGAALTLVMRDPARHEWSVGRLPAPARRVDWLDAPAVDSSSRRALARAFDQAALYSEDARTAGWRPSRADARVALVAARRASGGGSSRSSRSSRARRDSPTLRRGALGGRH